jgi:phenylalanyl-tRNA synthetase beta chain
MLASLSWLRALCPVDEPAELIAEALTSRGLTVDALTPAGEDHALDIDLPANRPDCLGHLGLARELSAAFARPLASPASTPPGEGEAADEAVRIEIEDSELCPRYTAGIVRGIKVGPSPGWVVRRLEVCGLRSINNVVDASNIVMLELGNPIHFFDLALIGGGVVHIRRARAGERLKTLDGELRRLSPEMLVISDAERPIALAGVIGGAETEIGDGTSDILIEAASFKARSVRATSRKLALQTDAGYRFSRGVDPEAVPAAQALAARLLAELAGGRAAPGTIDAYPLPPAERKLTLRLGQLRRLLGYAPGRRRVEEALTALQLSPKWLEGNSIEATAPSWRIDLEREADVVEEVARHIGYGKVPVQMTGLPSVATAAAAGGAEERSRDLLSYEGFHEVFGYAMIAENEDAPFIDAGPAAPLHLTNPIVESSAWLRRSVLPGLLRAVDLNHRRGVRNVRLYEVGRIFLPAGPGKMPVERLHAGLVWSGAGQPPHWAIPQRDVDLFDVTGLVEKLLCALSPETPFERGRCALDGYHPGRSVAWRAPTGEEIARCGSLHPQLQQSLPHTVYLAEIDIEFLEHAEPSIHRFKPLPRLTAVTRDLAVVMTGARSYGEVTEALQAVSPPAPVEIEAVDSYSGPPLGRDEYALTIRFVLQPAARALKEEEIEGYRKALVEVLDRRLGVKIRS